MHHKEVQTIRHVFVHISAARPEFITSTHSPSTRLGSNAIQPTVFIVRYTESSSVLDNRSKNAVLSQRPGDARRLCLRRHGYAPQAYQPVQYSNNVPWTSSTCSAVYSTSYQTSTKAVPTVITTTGYKPSTWTSTRPTIITSVYTTFKPATTTLTSTVTSTYIGK
jgi:hypothetical protein